MLQIDLTLPIMMILFIVFAVLMNQVFFKPVTRLLAERQAYLADAKKQADAALSKLASLQEDYDARLKGAHAQSQSTIQAAIKEAEAKRQVLLDQVSLEVQDHLAHARASIQAERERAVESLGAEVGAFSDLITRKVLGNSLVAAGGSES